MLIAPSADDRLESQAILLLAPVCRYTVPYMTVKYERVPSGLAATVRTVRFAGHTGQFAKFHLKADFFLKK